jgi:hypothetical protein
LVMVLAFKFFNETFAHEITCCPGFAGSRVTAGIQGK